VPDSRICADCAAGNHTGKPHRVDGTPIDDGRHSTVRLSEALAAIPGVPKAMLTRVIDGYYHDYLSPLAMPELQLMADLRELASAPATPRNSRPLLRQLAGRVIDGEFDATRAESDAWARSPEGQETLRQLGMVKP
jgi:hypothetical protein